MTYSLGKHKEHRHHDQSHMMVPGAPFSYLIIRHTAFAFGVLKCALNPISLSLHPRQPFQRCASRGVGQRDFCIRYATKTLRDHQCPLICGLGFSIPNVYLKAKTMCLKVSSAGFAQFQNRLPGKITVLYYVTDFNAFGIRGVALMFGTTVCLFLWDIWFRILQIHLKIRMHINHKLMPHGIQGLAKTRTLAVAGVGSHPSKANAALFSMANYINGNFIFCLESAIRFRNAGFCATLRIIGPFFGNIKTRINRHRVTPIGQSAKYGNLSVINLAKAAQPLPCCTYRHASLLFKAALINQQASVIHIAQKIISILGNVIHYLPGIPFGMCEKLLKIARSGVRDNFGHPIHVFPRTGLHQTASVLARLIADVMGVTGKMVRVGFHKRNKAPADAGERRRLLVFIGLPPGLGVM